MGRSAAAGDSLFSVQAVPSVEIPSSRATSTLSNVWVIQFDASGKTVQARYVGTVSAGQNVKTTLSAGTGYTIAILANGPDSGGLSATKPASISEFKNALLYTDRVGRDDEIPLSGLLENVRVLDNGQVVVGDDLTVVPSVTIKRILAKINLLLEYMVSGATLDGVWLYDVPLGASFGLDEGVTNFPDASSSSLFTFSDTFKDGLPADLSSGAGTVTHTWYIGDNRRGTNANVRWENQKGGANALKKATFARIKTHRDDSPVDQLLYDVYLGENVTSDFNVLRNYDYTFRVRIGGSVAQQAALPEKDMRVTAGKDYKITSASVDPHPENFQYSSQIFTVTLSGMWGEPVPVRAWIDDSADNAALASANVPVPTVGQNSASAQILVPANPSFTDSRKIWFQYKWNGKWVDIIFGVQPPAQALDTGGPTELETPDPNKTSTSWNTGIDYCKNKTDQGGGWRVPTLNELLYWWVVEPSIPDDVKFNNYYYLSASKHTNNNYFQLLFSDGDVGARNASEKHNYRCVKTANTAMTYPQIKTENGGVVVVMRDEKGGTNVAALRTEKLSQTADPSDNGVSWKFRVQKGAGASGKNWADARSYCDNLVEENLSDWRLPSQREGIILWLLGGNEKVTISDKNDTGVGDAGKPITTSYLYEQEGFTTFKETDNLDLGNYWLATQIDNNKAWSIGFSTGDTDGSGAKSEQKYVRCIHDID